MKKNRKILLAGGCSFTEHTRVSCYDPSLSTDFPRWPEVLAEKLDMEYVNLGQWGCSNQEISTSIYEYLIENPKKEIGLVCCLWTEYIRTLTYNIPQPYGMSCLSGCKLFHGRLNELKTLTDDWITYMVKYSDKFLDLLYYYAKGTNTKSKTIVENIIKNNIKIFHDLECMLSLRNIPYLYLQGVFPFWDRDHLIKDRGLEKIYAPSHEQIFFYLLKYEKYFNKEKFIGWPGLYAGSWAIPSDRLFFGKKESNDCWISEIDQHPNEKGHQVIANHFYKKTEKLYSHLLKKEGENLNVR